MPASRHPVAAPPDAAEHHGSSTTPDQILETGEGEAGPPTDQDPSHGIGTRPGSKLGGWVSLAILVLLGLLFYALLRL